VIPNSSPLINGLVKQPTLYTIPPQVTLHPPQPSTQTQIPQNTQSETLIVPPPQWHYVEPRPKPQKTLNINSPKYILFVKQRKNPKFLQNIKPHLVTLFSVRLRVLPFSDHLPKTQNSQNCSNYPQSTAILAHSRRPILRDHGLILF
jgi:hypothetical protein